MNDLNFVTCETENMYQSLSVVAGFGSDELANSLCKVNSIVTEQDIELWAEHAFVQEMNMQIDTLSEQIQDMRQKTAAAISENDERETEIEDIDKSKRWMIHSTDLTRKSIILLAQQIRHCEKESADWRQKYNDTLKEQNEKFELFKIRLTEDLPLYEKLAKLKLDGQRLLVNLKFKTSLLEQTRKIKRQRCEIKKSIYNADIVNFVKVCLNYKTSEEMSIEAKELQKLNDKLRLRLKEMQQIKAKKEAEESAGSCWLEFEEEDSFELPPASRTFGKSTFSRSNSSSSLLDFCKNTKLIVKNFKMPSMPQKYKSQGIDFGTTPKKLKPNDSNVKILSVQTIFPEKDSTYQSAAGANLLSATQKDSNKSAQFDTTTQSVDSNEKKLSIAQKESEFELTSQAVTDFALQKQSNKFELNAAFETEKPSRRSCMKSLTQNSDANEINDAQMCTQTFNEKITPTKRNLVDNNISQEFPFDNMSTDEATMFNITGDFDNAILSTANDVDCEFVFSPTMSTNDDASFFKPNTSDHFFKLF